MQTISNLKLGQIGIKAQILHGMEVMNQSAKRR